MIDPDEATFCPDAVGISLLTGAEIGRDRARGAGGSGGGRFAAARGR